MSEPDLQEKIAFLSRAGSYPEGTNRVERKETHMSCVFLTDRHAWKLKKPAHYDYLDFSTVEARRKDCEMEVELNRRLAPDVYLGTIPLTVDPGGGMRLGGEGRVIDWLVKMRRLPEHRMLDVTMREHTVTVEDARNVGCLLARFYRQARRFPLSPAAYLKRLETEMADCVRELGQPQYALPAERIEAIQAVQTGILTREAAMFEVRAQEDRIVDGHGDLRPEHICLEAEPVIIDCLEFNADIRILDAVSELAFLALECERLGAPWVGQWILETYSRETGDWPPAPLVAYYKRHHALVRAKIAAWHLKDGAVQDPSQWITKAQDYLRRASTGRFTPEGPQLTRQSGFS